MSDAAGNGMPRAKRRHADVRRRNRVAVTFTDDELARLRAAARRRSQALAALIAKAALDLVEMRGVPASDAFLDALKELMVAAELVRQTGDRLNRTGGSGLELDGVVARAERLMQRLDDAALEVRKKL